MRRDPLIELPRALLQPGSATTARFVMGVDGGATKTLAAVLDLRDQVIHLGHGASSNPDAAGSRAATQALLRATDEALGRAGIAREDVGAAVLAIAGTDTEAVAADLGASTPTGWSVVNDVVGAWAAATGGEAGVGAISGTGSNVFGVGPHGRAWRAGGWGHVLGDEGSGYWLAVHSIRAALRDRDRSGPQTALSEAALRFFGAASLPALAALVYSKPLSKGEIAAFATETARVARAGDEVARKLYERAAAELGRQITTVIAQTELQGEFPVGLIGSAFRAGSLFVEPLAAVVADMAPLARVTVVDMPPVGGCLLLAARAAGRREQVDAAGLGRLLDAVLAREGVFRE